MSPGKILVYGATGQVARELSETGAARGLNIVSLSRREADLMHPEQAAGAMGDIDGIRAVIIAAAYTAVDRAETDEDAARTINAESPGAIAAACAAAGVPIIHLSTDYVFAGIGDRAHREDDPVDPQSVYGRTKLAGEVAVRRQCDQHVILRTSWVYSPHGQNFVKTMLRLGSERDVLRVVADQVGAPTSATDIAEAVFAILDGQAAGLREWGVFHLAGAGEASWADFAEAVFDCASPVWGRRPDVHRIPASEYPTPARRPANSRLDCGKLESVYGYRAPDWRVSLAGVMTRLGYPAA